MMYIDLNIPVPSVDLPHTSRQSKKGKGAVNQMQPPSKILYSPAQIAGVENRVDLLVHLGYTVLAFNQTVNKRVDPKTHLNVLDNLFERLRKRSGVVFLKRITIVLDEDSEKGFGLASSSASLFGGYDIIALTPTTLGTFSLACLTHSQPSPLTAHIISLPLTLPRLPFHLKHTMVRTAIKNGAVFEINYAGALGEEADSTVTDSVSGAKRNWWASAREVVKVTKGKGLIISGGVMNEGGLRAPRDVANLITMLNLAQDLAQSASTKIPQSLVLRAQTRKTYRAILSEPKLIIPPKAGETPSSSTESPLLTLEISPERETSITRVTSSEQAPNLGKRPFDESSSGNDKKDKANNKRNKRRKATISK